MNTWPQSFPCPQLEGSALDADTQLIGTPVGLSPAQTRQTHRRFPHTIDVSFVVPQSQYNALVPWINRYGFHWFEMPLTTFQGNMLPQTVRFVSDLEHELVLTDKGPHWRVTGVIEWLPH